MNLTCFIKILITFVLVFNNLSYSSQNAKILSKGDVAPFDGVLLKDNVLQELYKNKETLQIVENKVLSLKELSYTQEEIIKVHRSQIKEHNKELRRERRKNFWSNVGYFTLGCLLTGVAAKVAIESTRR